MIFLNDSVRELHKIGPKTEVLYNKLGIYTIRDLIRYFPRDYFIYGAPAEPSQMEEGRILALEGVVASAPLSKRTQRGDMVLIWFRTGDVLVQLLWFGMPYIRSTVKKNMRFVMHGRLETKNGRYQMIHPKVFTPADYEKVKNKMLPVYRLTKGLTNKLITETMGEALEIFRASAEYDMECLPFGLEKQHQLIPFGEAVCALHFPADETAFLKARRRFVFEELFFFQYGLKQLEKEQPTRYNLYPVTDFSLCREWLETLPFTPTQDQYRAMEAVKADLQGSKAMGRMLQGDVGSGKTLVAFYAVLAACSNGYQAAIMAPTEVLAKQHYETCSAWCSQLRRQIRVVLLTGALKAKEKAEAYRQIASGEAQLVIGTHAVIQDAVTFHQLALVVIDEQHRFGVVQRAALTEKGAQVHSLYMTATPIPRTLALLLYGNTDISELAEKPADRLPIKNCMIPFSKRKTAFQFIYKEIAKGHQAFIICPMIEENEMFPCENIEDYQKQVRAFFGTNAKTGILHGRMGAEKKEEIMAAFAAGKIDILISTTVIEVGIDIPNATVMMIENAERFGLSQLHQLRGRVGRGKAQSYCIFVNAADTKESRERLEVLVRSNDGFYIAGEDLKLRGPGELFGCRQSGEMDFVFADIYRDSDILSAVSDAAQKACSQTLSEADGMRIAQGLMKFGNYEIQTI